MKRFATFLLVSLAAAASSLAEPLANMSWVRQNFLPIAYAETDPLFSIWKNTFETPY